MAGSWRTTARTRAVAAATAVRTRASRSLRRLVDQASASDVGGPTSRPTPLHFLEPARDLSVPVPTYGIGFRPTSSTARPVAVSEPMSSDHDHDDAAPVPDPIISRIPERMAAIFSERAEDEVVDDPEAAPRPFTPAVPPHRLVARVDPDDIIFGERRRPEAGQAEAAQERAPSPTPAKLAKVPRRRKHHRADGAISGTVTSTRGRGLRGMVVRVVDADKKTVTTTLTGAGGSYVVEGLPLGRYRIAVSDEDGDFAPRWVGGSTFASAAKLTVKDGRVRRRADVRLISAAAAQVDVRARKKKVRVTIEVTERGTGVAATGTVRLTTKALATELALVKGRARITLLGSATSSPTLPKRLEVDYLGDDHVAPASVSATLR